MPPLDSNRKLAPQHIELLKRWVRAGAPWGRHWAFVTPKRPAVPEAPRGAGGQPAIRNPIDNFIVARLAKEGLAPAPEVGKETLIRRVTLDLTGLPPTPAEVDAFVADDSPDAYEKVVGRLLASQRYGERWAWDWLDAARYADSNGFQADPDRTMWPWRDWVVEAINGNMPYDQFTVEQLAGDLLPSPTPKQILATGFSRNNMFNGEGGRIPEETRVENVFDRLETTSTTWLGVSFGCARCHDHKFDPFKQSEYYQLFDFFNQTSEKGTAAGSARSGQVSPIIDMRTEGPKAQEKTLDERYKKLAAQVEAMEKRMFPRPQGKTAAASPAAQALAGTVVEALEKPPEKRGIEQMLELASVLGTRKPAYARKLTALKLAKQEINRFGLHLPRVMVMDQIAEPRDTFILVKGGYDKHAGKVMAAIPASLSRPPETAGGVPARPAAATAPASTATAATAPANATAAPARRLNRLDLARWLISPENPLTARVTVNRFWQAFFGIGIVKTVEDFGVQGEMPAHPELLDWLATELSAGGWDIAAVVPRGGTGLRTGGLPGVPHFAPKAKRVIYLFQNGAPSHVDLFDYKPKLKEWHGRQIPDEVVGGRRFSTMTGGQTARPVLSEISRFKQHGDSGAWVSSFLPHTAAISDKLCFVKSMYTESVNHAPAITFLLSGGEMPGRPSMGAWLGYGLGSDTQDLPAFVVMTSRDKENSCGQIFYDFYWGSGFLPSKYQGVKFRGSGDPVLYLSNPSGVSPVVRRGILDDLAKMNEIKLRDFGDPEIATRIAQYEMAYKMQTSVPELVDLPRSPSPS